MNLILHCPTWVRWLACAVHLAGIAVVSLMPPSAFPKASWLDLPGMDKIVHFLMYGFLGALLHWAALGISRNRPQVRWVFGGAIIYGILMEIAQSMFTHGLRAFGWGDIAANVAGAFVFWHLAGWWLGRSKKKHGANEFPEPG